VPDRPAFSRGFRTFLADTQPNADGALESILSDYDEAAVAPQAVVPTATGAISLFKAIKPFRN